MTINAWLQIGLLIVLLLALVKPLGWYMARVYENKPCGLDPLLAPLERALYRVCAIRPSEEMDWKGYATAMLWFNAVGMLLLYGMQRLQTYLPLNPAGLQAARQISPSIRRPALPRIPTGKPIAGKRR